jgi:hypothetical protein
VCFLSFLFFVLWEDGECVFLIFLVFCVVVGWGACFLSFSFLCCGRMGACFLSSLFSVLW